MKINQKALSNQSGFTLVEVMVVSVIFSVLMLAFSSYMYQQVKLNKAAENKQSYGQLKSSVLEASSQSESLSASENMQFNPSAGGGTCLPPCSFTNNPSSGAYQCLYFQSNGNVPSPVPAGCTIY
jgi:prepilin-type N-terminal cleavage/methylation domain-containing protein